MPELNKGHFNQTPPPVHLLQTQGWPLRSWQAYNKPQTPSGYAGGKMHLDSLWGAVTERTASGTSCVALGKSLNLSGPISPAIT